MNHDRTQTNTAQSIRTSSDPALPICRRSRTSPIPWAWRIAPPFLLGAVAGLLPTPGLRAEARGGIIAPDQSWQVFLTDAPIASQQGVTAVLHHPEKFGGNPLLKSDAVPLESRYLDVTSVVRDPESGWLYMYYEGAGPVPGVAGGGGFLDLKRHSMFARSKDGVHWERPTLGLVDLPGVGRENNCFPMKVERVDVDPNPPSLDRRFVMIYEVSRETGGFSKYFAVSPDGIHWKELGVALGDLRKTAKPGGATPSARYIYTCQNWIKDLSIRGRRFRGVYRMQSDDLDHWTGAEWAFPQHAAMYNHNWEDYGMPSPLVAANRYHGVEIGLGWLFHSDPAGHTIAFGIRSDGTVDTILVTSEDTIHWHRVNWPEPFIERGQIGSWDWGMVYGASFVELGDRLLFYYNGFNGLHGHYQTFTAGIGLATLPKDRIISLDAENSPGEVTTKPFRCRGGKLELNADASNGPIQIEVLDQDGRPVAGFGKADCNPVTFDQLVQEATWKSGKTLANLQGQIVSLRFLLSPGAKLYAFRTTD